METKFECSVFSLWEANGCGSAGLVGNLQRFAVELVSSLFGFLALLKRWGWDIPMPSEVSGFG